MATYFIDSLFFSAATAVYTNIGLTTHAPDGYYSFSGTYRQQSGGVLLAPTNICVATPIIAVDDAYSAIVTVGINGYNILANDTIGGSAATTSNVVISQLTSSSPNVHINTSTGAVVAATGTSVGSYSITYKICEIGNPSNCDTANIAITINPLPNYNCFNSGATCTSACTTDAGTFSYFINRMEGAGEPAPTASCSATTVYPVYSAEEITEFTTGMTIYTDSGLTNEFSGSSKWYGIGANDNGPSNGKFEVNNTGTLVTKQTCPDYCCGEMTFYSSNFTGENLNYGYNDCYTGVLQFVTVYYGEPPLTVYGRIPCGLNPFNMTRIRSTGAELCDDYTLTYVLYAQTNALAVGDYLFEDSSGVYTFQHGTIYIKDLNTDKIWKVDTYGKILEEYTLCP